MIPQRLTLRGFLSYLDETTLDLTSVNVACISGANGAGKSSLFDAITWALFGKARRSDDALIHDAADDCLVALEFEYEDNLYRVQRQKVRQKGAVLEFHIRSDEAGWKPLTEAGLRATEERIRETLRLDYDTFINASFFLQGKADMFTQQNPTRRKEILSSILGLDIWEEYREAAALRRRNTDTQAKGLRTYLDEIQQELAQEDERRERLQLLQTNLQSAEALRQEKEKHFTEAQHRYQELRLLKEQEALIASQLAGAHKRQESVQALIEARTRENQDNQQLMKQADPVEKQYQSWRALQTELERWNQLAATYHQLSSQRANLAGQVQAEEARLRQEQQSLRQEQTRVQSLRQQLPALKAQVDELEREQKASEEQTTQLPELEKQLSEGQDQRAALQAENAVLKKRMLEIKDSIQQLQAASSSCPLCGQDLNDNHRREISEAYQQEGTWLGDQHRQNSQKIIEMDKAIREHTRRISDLRTLLKAGGARQNQMGGLSSRLKEGQTQLDDWEANGGPKLLQVEAMLNEQTFLPQAQEEIQKLDDAVQALGYDEPVHQQTAEQEAALRLAEELFQRLQTARTAQEGLLRELETLEQSKTSIKEEITSYARQHDHLQSIIRDKESSLPDLGELETELTDLRLSENRLRQECGAAQQMVDVLETLRRRQADINSQLEQSNQDITRLKLLEAAFSKDGVPAMLIEEALPEIESQANLILDRLSGGRMSINFETEREYKDKRREDKKQTLDILISDSSGRREYELFSGGEAFRINFAIRLALSRVLAGRAGARLQTLVIDEGFGSQDAEGRQRLVEAINLVSPDFSKILVITHLDELKDAFPARIEVQKTGRGSTVEVIV